MFGDLMGDLQKQQEEMQEKLSTIVVTSETGDGAVMVEATCDMQIKSVKMDVKKLDPRDADMMEDLLVVALNEALDAAKKKAAEESAKLIQGMMPPGMGDLGGMFK